MGYSNLQCNDSAGVRRISIDRADKLNALNRATLTELEHAFNRHAKTTPCAW